MLASLHFARACILNLHVYIVSGSDCHQCYCHATMSHALLGPDGHIYLMALAYLCMVLLQLRNLISSARNLISSQLKESHACTVLLIWFSLVCSYIIRLHACIYKNNMQQSGRPSIVVLLKIVGLMLYIFPRLHDALSSVVSQLN